MLSDGLGNNYVYDAFGQMTSDGGTSYVYGADGNRVAKMSGGSPQTQTVYFGGRPIARWSGGGITPWTDLIYGPRGLLVEVPQISDSATYRMTDHLGTLVGTMSSSGIATQDVAPFGEIFSGGVSDPFQFTGKERDAESGNDYFGARYYASNMGRFSSPIRWVEVC